MQFQFLGPRKFSTKVEGIIFLFYKKYFISFGHSFFFEGPQAELLSTTPSDVKYPEVWKFLSELKLEKEDRENYYEKLIAAKLTTTEKIFLLKREDWKELKIPLGDVLLIEEALEELMKGVTFPKTFNLKREYSITKSLQQV